MLSNGFDAPLHLRLKPSRHLLYFQLTVLLLAFVAVAMPTGLLLYVRIGLGVLLLANAIIIFVMYNRQARLLAHLVWHRHSGWEEIKTGESADSIEKQLWPSQQCMINKSFFVLLKLIGENKQKQVLIFKDQCENPDNFRRLRVLMDCLSEATEQKNS